MAEGGGDDAPNRPRRDAPSCSAGSGIMRTMLDMTGRRAEGAPAAHDRGAPCKRYYSITDGRPYSSVPGSACTHHLLLQHEGHVRLTWSAKPARGTGWAWRCWQGGLPTARTDDLSSAPCPGARAAEVEAGASPSCTVSCAGGATVCRRREVAVDLDPRAGGRALDQRVGHRPRPGPISTMARPAAGGCRR